MATPATTCIEEGCTKFRVKNKRCVKHSNEYLARQAELPSPASPAAAGESPVVDAAHGGASMGEQKSLLALVKGKLVEPVAPGFFLDFTGHEDLLGRVLASSEDVNGDILVLLTALLDGKLQSSDDIFGVLCHG